MIRQVRVTNYKSVLDLTLDLGRVTVLIGANGSGKSNILEAIAFAAAAAQNKLDNEFLFSRGISVTEARFMRCAFMASRPPEDHVQILIEGKEVVFNCEVYVDESGSYPKWHVVRSEDKKVEKLLTAAKKHDEEAMLALLYDNKLIEVAERIVGRRSGPLRRFLIFAPENSGSSHIPA